MTTPSHAAPPPSRGPRSPVGPAAGGAEMSMRRRVGPLRVTQLLLPARGPRFPKSPAAGGARPRCACVDASRLLPRPSHGQWSRLGPLQAVPLRVAPCSSAAVRSRPAGPVGSRCWLCLVEHAAWCRSCRVADGVVHQVGPYGTARVSSKLVKPHLD